MKQLILILVFAILPFATNAQVTTFKNCDTLTVLNKELQIHRNKILILKNEKKEQLYAYIICVLLLIIICYIVSKTFHYLS